MKKIFFLLFITLAKISFSQLPNTDIWVFKFIVTQDSVFLADPENITNRTGYDNQPTFSPDARSILYTSIRDEKQSDIYKYDLNSKQTTQFTNTSTTSEYSPTFMPDGKNISVVMVEPDSTQRVWKFPIKGGKPSIVLEKVDSVGYHIWYNKGTMGVFILTEPATLQIVQTWNQVPHIVADSIGRCFRMMGDEILFYTEKTKDGKDQLCQFILPGMATKKLDVIMESEDYAFFNHDNIVYGKNSELYFIPSFDTSKKKTIDLSKYGIKKITRLAVSPDGKKIAIVAE